MIKSHLALSMGLATLAVGPSATAGVIVVGPGSPHTEINAAVASASEGDVLLVKGGNYDPVTIDDKGVSIVADVGAVVFVRGVKVQSLTAGKTVVLDRLICTGGYGAATLSVGLWVNECVGAVRIQNCQVFGANGDGFVSSCNEVGEEDGATALSVRRSGDVAIVQSLLRGGDGSYMFQYNCFGDLWFGGDGGHGLYCEESKVTVHHSSIEAGNSGTGSYSKAAPHGIFAFGSPQGHGSRLVLVNVEARGGSSGDALDGLAPTEGGSPGNGMWLNNSSHARVIESSFEGGTQGGGLGNPGGAIGDPIQVFPGSTVTYWPNTAKGLGSDEVVREGQTSLIQLTGESGDVAFLYASLKTTSFHAPQLGGSFFLDPSTLVGPIAHGVVQGASPVNASVVVPLLPAGLLSEEVYLQGVLVGPTNATLTNWVHVTVLDASL